MLDDMYLMELIYARLCHDISGPIGAIGNGIEFLSESKEDIKHRAVELIDLSAKEMSARLGFYRSTYGPSYHVGETDMAKIRTISDSFLRRHKITLDWPDSHLQDTKQGVSGQFSKLLLSVIFMSFTSLVQGGIIKVRVLKEEADKFQVSASGKIVKIDEAARGLFANGEDLHGVVARCEPTSRNAHIYYSHLFAKRTHYSVKLNCDDPAGMVITVGLKAA
jgi:histidine phosphotransferase ChpT